MITIIILVRLLGRYLNFGTEAKRLRDLCKKAAEDKVTRTTVESVSSRSTKLNAEQCEEILRRYQAGGRPVDIARDFSVTEWTIQNVRKRAGVPTRPKGMSEQALARASDLYATGTSFRKIAVAVGYDARTVTAELRARGIAS